MSSFHSLVDHVANDEWRSNTKHLSTEPPEQIWNTIFDGSSKCSLFKGRQRVFDDASDMGKLTKSLSHFLWLKRTCVTVTTVICKSVGL